MSTFLCFFVNFNFKCNLLYLLTYCLISVTTSIFFDFRHINMSQITAETKEIIFSLDDVKM